MNTDANEISAIEQRLKTSAKNLHRLSPAMAAAKQAKAYDGDRRKNILARYTLPHLKSGESATAAETMARASDAYQAELNALADQLGAAEAAVAAYDAEYASWESCRSLLSFAKASMNL